MAPPSVAVQRTKRECRTLSAASRGAPATTETDVCIAPPRSAVQSVKVDSKIDAAVPWSDTHGTGDELSAADIQMSFPVEALMVRASQNGAALPNLTAYMARIQARPAYARAVEKGGPLTLLS